MAQSWIIIEKKTGQAVLETFEPKKVKLLNTDKYKAMTARDYLGKLNMKKTALEIDERERDTILAALRYWQRSDSADTPAETLIATRGGYRDALQADEIERLIDRVNTAP